MPAPLVVWPEVQPWHVVPGVHQDRRASQSGSGGDGGLAIMGDVESHFHRGREDDGAEQGEDGEEF